MRRTHRWGGILAACCIVVTLSPSTGGAREVPRLGRLNVLRSDLTIAVTVEVPDGGRLSTKAFDNPDVRFVGGDDIVGVSLVKHPIRPDSPQWVATRWPWCEEFVLKCSTRERAVVVAALNWPNAAIEGETLHLPAGRYSIYALSSRAAPLTTRLRIRGLEGKRYLEGDRAAIVDASERELQGPGSDQGGVQGEFYERNLARPGLFISAWSVGSGDGNYGAYDVQECFIKGERPEGPALPGACTSDSGADLGGTPIRDEVWVHRPLGPGRYVNSMTWTRAGSETPREPPRAYAVWWSY